MDRAHAAISPESKRKREEGHERVEANVDEDIPSKKPKSAIAPGPDTHSSTLPPPTPSITPIINRSPLLELTGELRNEIVAYALTTESQHAYLLIRDEHFTFFEEAYGAKRPINQLRNVCRQLRSETEHLEAQYNRVIAMGPEFLKLARNGGDNLKCRIREVSVCPLQTPFFTYKNPDEFVLHPLIEFYLQHNKATVQIRLQDWNFAGKGGHNIGSFLNLGTVIECALRGIGTPLHSSGSGMLKK